MRNKDTHSRITDKCRCLFVVAYSAMSITGLSSVLAVENHDTNLLRFQIVWKAYSRKNMFQVMCRMLTECL